MIVSAAEIVAARYYTFKVDGPFGPGPGERFDRGKVILIDMPEGFFSRRPSATMRRAPGPNDGKAPLGILPTVTSADLVRVDDRPSRQLMPVHQYDPQEGSHRGYMTLGFFVPHHAYAQNSDAETAVGEFRAMVKALHAADIEVILDVVYNHTTEGDQNGPTYSFRGNNSTHYALDPQRFSTLLQLQRLL